MEREYYCINGHLANLVCCQKNCKQPALICEVKDCEVQKRHNQCILAASRQRLVQRLELKANYIHKQTSQRIIQFYYSTIKKITIAIQSLRKKLQESNIELYGNQRKLHRFISKGKLSDITGELVYNANKDLTIEKQHQKKQNNIQQLKKSIDDAELQINKILNRFKIKQLKIQVSPKNDVVNLFCSKNTTVNDVIEQLEDKMGEALDFSKIYFGDTHLNNKNEKLINYGIQPDSTLKVFPFSKQSQQIFIKIKKQQTPPHQIIINLNKNVWDIKTKIRNDLGYEEFQQRLYLHNKVLKNQVKLVDYNIEKNDILVLEIVGKKRII